MTEYDNSNQGVLWRNSKKEKPSQPTHTGKANLDGTNYWLAAWPDKEEQDSVNCCMTAQENQEDETWFTLRKMASQGSRPDYKGEVNGLEIACWINEMKRDTENLKTGDKYLSLKFGGQQQTEQGQNPEAGDPEDDIPF
jgi:hypothetical protein